MVERGGTMKKNRKKRAALTAAGLAAAAGVVLGSAFADPVDLLQDGPQPSPAAADTLDGGEGGGDSAQDLRGAKRVRSRIRSGVREAVLSLPAWVRAAAAFPLWCLGWAILQLAGLAWPFLSPVAAVVGKWVLTALLLLGILAVSAKLACPEIPLKRILSRRCFGTILLLLGLFGAADAALPLVWDGYARFSPLLHLLGGGLAMTVPLVALLRRHRREEKVSVPRETEEQRIRRTALELADTVCPPRPY